MRQLFPVQQVKARLYTSYYGGYKGNQGVSITVAKPEWFVGRHYPALAPTKELLYAVKSGAISEDRYSEDYLALLNSRSNAGELSHKQVLEDLEDGSVLLCYEAKGKFCHRHLAAKWLRLGGINIIEL